MTTVLSTDRVPPSPTRRVFTRHPLGPGTRHYDTALSWSEAVKDLPIVIMNLAGLAIAVAIALNVFMRYNNLFMRIYNFYMAVCIMLIATCIVQLLVLYTTHMAWEGYYSDLKNWVPKDNQWFQKWTDGAREKHVYSESFKRAEEMGLYG